MSLTEIVLIMAVGFAPEVVFILSYFKGKQ